MQDVLIFGSINMDVVTFCKTHPRVGETLFGDKVSFFPGGKGANQAVAAARCAGSSRLIGCVGADAFGEQMLSHLRANAVETDAIEVIPGTSTGVAIIVVDEKGQNSILVTSGANALAKAPDALSATGGPVVALAQFESPLPEITKLFRLVKEQGGLTLLNPSPYQTVPAALLQVTSILVLNEHEYSQLINKPATEDLAEIMGSLQTLDLPVPCCVITLGKQGVILAEKGQPALHIPGQKITPVDTTGAGDCFTGWFAAELAKGCPPQEAANRANKAAALSATRPGAGSSMPTVAEVDAFSIR